MTLSLADNAIALLIDLAERGEIDPWDVKVIEVVDRFLSKLQPAPTQEAGRAPYEADLSHSGQAFLYASMLLLLKADSLARQEVEADAEAEPLEIDPAFGTVALPLHLERQIRRRATAPPAPNRRVTLQELIAQLHLVSAALKEGQPRSRRGTRRARPQSHRQAVRTIAQLAHQENLSEIAAALEQMLAQHWQEISQGEDWLAFEQLLDWWTNAQSATPTQALQAAELHHVHDRVGIFWALLFLSAQSKVELSQEEFYQDLKVRTLTDEPALNSGVPSMFASSD